jgi:ABC-type bacteriocin/lantibiotic exporter with double-glycine peptidase domain
MSWLRWFVEQPIKKVCVLQFDFSKPWWHIFLIQWRLIIPVLITEIIGESYYAIFPILLGLALDQQSVQWLFIAIGGALLCEFISWLWYHPQLTKLLIQSKDSFQFSAYTYLLEIDPVHHQHWAHGTIVGKIQRTTLAYETLVFEILIDLLPLIISITAACASIVYINMWLGLAATLSIIGIVTVFCYTMFTCTSTIEKQFNKQDDALKQSTIETLTLFSFIRTTFASDFIRNKLHHAQEQQIKTESSLLMTYRAVRTLFVLIYIISLGAVTLGVLLAIKNNSISAIIGASVLLTYYNTTIQIFSIYHYVKEILKAYRRIKDFYASLDSFGSKTYPVFIEQTKSINECHNNSEISLRCTNVTFAYPDLAPTFTNLSCEFSADRTRNSGFLGIVGASGSGKTTFLNILGGQFKPQQGTVYINDVDIYSIDDQTRQSLVAIQAQTTVTSMGLLKEVITFGLPTNHAFSDEILIATLQRVGLWNIFQSKQGLNSELKEGCLTLSGGQKQRLQFANLYLRAKHFQPLVILIDEPTSSLDEEKVSSIREMIYELSQNSLTIVISHNQNIIAKTKAILDFNLPVQQAVTPISITSPNENKPI